MAVLDGVDVGIPWHFGDPLREQRAMADGAGIVDRSNRAVVIVPGPDRLGWLHTICSQHLSDLRDGDATEALVLSPHGHVQQHWQVTELGDQVWLDVEPGTGDEVLGYLRTMQFFKRVEPADVSGEWAVLTLAGPRTVAVLTAAGLPVPEPARAVALDDGGFVRRMTGPAGDAADLIIARAGAAEIVERLVAAGAAPVGSWAYEARRVQARAPRLNFETDHRTIPHEVGWIGSAVHLNKGCYRGQETVARVQNLGKPPRRLVLVHLGSSDLPAAGTPVESGGRTVGFIGTAVNHYELGPIALAVVKRSLPADAELTAAGIPIALDPA